MAVVEPKELPCDPWTTEDRLCCPDQTDIDCEDVATPATYAWTDTELIAIASRILFIKSCRRFPGICEGLKLRPCAPCGCPDRCCSCRYEFIPLAGVYPVVEVTQVIQDGAIVPPASYRLDEYFRLVRIDGEHWRRSQDLLADPTVLGEPTLEITYSVGRSVPSDLQYAAALLACELKKACNGQRCSLPDRVTSVVRDGVSYQMVDPQDIANDTGSFGISDVDAILKNYKCKKPKLTSPIFHPLLEGSSYDRRGVRSM